MKILLVTETLLTGGAELFVLRLARALSSRGALVRIFNLNSDAINYDQVNQIAPQIDIISFNLKGKYFFKKFDGLCYRTGIDFSSLRWLQAKALKNHCDKEHYDVVHSNLFITDLVTVSALREAKTKKIVTTIHGDYVQYPGMIARRQKTWFLNFTRKLDYILTHVDEIVTITDQQIQFFEPLLVRKRARLHKIYNGYDGLPVSNNYLRRKLGIKEGEVVFGMVARGIEEKGWRYLLEAFSTLNDPTTHLVFVGASDFLEKLKEETKNSNVHFVGFSDKPLDWINIMDVGLFGSYIENEGLPTTIIEYLYLNKPVISTNVGECKSMLIRGEHKAGFVIDLKNGKPDVEAFAEKMRLLKSNKDLLYKFSRSAESLKSNFDMERCVDAYLELYKSA